MAKRLLAVVLFGVFLALGINLFVLFYPKGAVYRRVQEVPRKQVALVLGAQVYRDGGLSRTLRDRVMLGIKLYQAGKVEKILVSGDHGRLKYDEVNAMRRFILKRGIPAEDIFMDHAGFDTYDSLYRARAIFEVRSAVLVSQAFHLKRALYIAKGLGLDAVGIDADKPYIDNAPTRNGEIRETLARIKAFGEVLIHRQPKFLGKSIPITGDGRLTMDRVQP